MIKLADRSECTGCMACSNVCSRNAIMTECTKEGFSFPVIDRQSCIACGACVRVCPGLQNDAEEECGGWREPVLYAAVNRNIKERMSSSSGGIFLLLAKAVLDRGGIVFGAEYDPAFAIRHGWTEKAEDLSRFQTSKYVQSEIGVSFQECKAFLEEGRWVLFTGTSCQIDGLLRYLGRKYERLYTVDLICSGNTSPGIWHDYLEMMKEKYQSEIEKVNFRDKQYGWDRFALSITFSSGKKYIRILPNDPWAYLFLHHQSLRECCYSCNYKSLYHTADFTLGDFWGVQGIYPEWYDDKGLSFVLVNTERACDFWELIQGVDKHIVSHEVLKKHNTTIIRSADRPRNREDFYKDYQKMPFQSLLKKYTRIPAWRKSNFLFDHYWKIRIKLAKYYHKLFPVKTEGNGET